MSTTDIIRLTGTVKWFNNRVGFGFITVRTDGEYLNKDIFVHYTSIRVLNSQYKYLVQGEYVDFTLSIVSDCVHEYQASDVTGVYNGPIMCELKKTPQQERRPVSTKVSTEGKREYLREKDYKENDGYVKVVRSRITKL